MDVPSTSASFIDKCDTINVCIEEKDSVRSVKHFLITWTIENFLKFSYFREKPLVSPSIQIDPSDSLSLTVLPYFLFTGEKKIRCCLHRNASNDKSVFEVTYRFGVKKSTVTWFQEKIKLVFPFNGTDEVNYDLLEYFVNPDVFFEQTLIILCEVYVTYNQNMKKVNSKEYSGLTADLMNLSTDLYNLFKRGEMTDAKVKAGIKEIYVHKAILSARSPVFADMFSDGQSCITVENQDYHIQNILLYLYSGNFLHIGLNGIWIGLYECAKQYKIRGLIQLLTPTEINVRSSMKKDNINFTWKINQFNSLKVKHGECITSPPFHVGSEKAPVWYLDIYPEGCQRFMTNIGIFLRTNDRSKCLDIKCQISILDHLNRVLYTKLTEKPVFPDIVFGFPEYIGKEKLHEDNLIQGESLILNCKIISLSSVESHDKTSSISQSAYEEFICFESLSSDMENLALEGVFSDCTLKISDTMFPVHRVVITARSAGLNRIIEASSNAVVQIENISPEALGEIIYFIYTGKMKTYSLHFTTKLYEGAKVLGMTILLSKCIEILTQALDIKSLCDITLFAYRQEEKMLFHSCVAFVKLFHDDVLCLVEWQNLMNTEQNLARLVYQWLQFIR